jgi:NADPH-dependent ferric siderophore reductase
VTLTGDDVPLFENATVGANNKVFLPDADGEIYFDGPKAIRRTYTHRDINLQRKEMYIDFVAHGDSGPASAWAISAKEGDKLGVAMKDVSQDLYSQADWYLLVGDATALPVLSVILETLPANAKGIAFIEVNGPEDELSMLTNADIQINWLHNATPGEHAPLVAAVRSIDLPETHDKSRFGYIAAEFATVKDLRHYLRKERGWEKEELYAYSYWKYGKSEDGSVSERQEEKSSI